jgi:hypothetical protein
MSMTFGESTSRKSSDFEYQSCWLCGCGPWRWCKGVGEIHMDKGRVGGESKGKETDGCPLTGGNKKDGRRGEHKTLYVWH